MPELTIGIVGPCKAGKTTLRDNLRAAGFAHVRQIAQEHSYVADMWQRLTNPDILVFLDVSFEESMARHRLNWNRKDYAEQHRRLRHARAHAHLYIVTDPFTPKEVLKQVLEYVQSSHSRL